MPGLEFDYRPSPTRVFWSDSLSLQGWCFVKYRGVSIYAFNKEYNIDFAQIYCALGIVLVNLSTVVKTYINELYGLPDSSYLVFLAHKDDLEILEGPYG